MFLSANHVIACKTFALKEIGPFHLITRRGKKYFVLGINVNVNDDFIFIRQQEVKWLLTWFHENHFAPELSGINNTVNSLIDFACFSQTNKQTNKQTKKQTIWLNWKPLSREVQHNYALLRFRYALRQVKNAVIIPKSFYPMNKKHCCFNEFNNKT